MVPTPALQVFYDGLCPLCSREIDHYRKQSGSDLLQFVDITESQFDAKKEGLDPQLVHRVMHVKNAQGTVVTGVDAFIAIWENLPRYQWLSRLAKKFWVHRILEGGYLIFSQIRPYLPRKSRDCEQSPYCDIKKP